MLDCPDAFNVIESIQGCNCCTSTVVWQCIPTLVVCWVRGHVRAGLTDCHPWYLLHFLHDGNEEPPGILEMGQHPYTAKSKVNDSENCVTVCNKGVETFNSKQNSHIC